MKNDNGVAEQEVKTKKHKGKHDKPKPWDEDPNIDRWKIEKFEPSWNDGGMLEVSSFSTLFPEYRGIFFSPLIVVFVSRESVGLQIRIRSFFSCEFEV